MAHTIRTIELKNRKIILVGTAHISHESVTEVCDLIRQENPGRICVELDQNRYQSMTQGSKWEDLDIRKVLKEKKGFFMLANLALSGFQKRMGEGVGAKPGEEMIAATKTADELGIPWSTCDREIQTTLKRAWAKSNFWNKCKLLASLVSSAFSNEKLSEEEIEKLKETSELEQMMNELASYLPSVKEVLIDERDRYLASKIFETKEDVVIAVIGAGHLPGIEQWLHKLDAGEMSSDTTDIDFVPPSSKWSKVIGWIIPIAIVALIVNSFIKSGSQAGLAMTLKWIIWNGSLSALGSALCMAHPLTIVVSFITAPLATLNPFVGVGLFAAITEVNLRKPKVKDFDRLNEDITSVKGFYMNRITHILLVFMMSSIGGMIGNFIALPVMASNSLH
ncbi:MAG: TraB/GumN family protein [Spirochaetaceae bacterium]|nr:TraB/GumN family protein [Spirochaetaceae bacterium]